MSDEYSWVAIIYPSWILTPCKIYRKYFFPVDCYCTLLVNIIFAFLHHLTFGLSACLLAGFCVIINHFFAMCMMFSCKSSLVLDNIFRSLSRSELNCGCGCVQFHSSHVDILLPYTIDWRQSLFLLFFFPQMSQWSWDICEITDQRRDISFWEPQPLCIHIVLITVFAVTVDIRQSEIFNLVIRLSIWVPEVLYGFGGGLFF